MSDKYEFEMKHPVVKGVLLEWDDNGKLKPGPELSIPVHAGIIPKDYKQ